MNLLRAVISVILPPVAVLDKGFGTFITIFVLTIFGYLPGVIGALVVNSGGSFQPSKYL